MHPMRYLLLLFLPLTAMAQFGIEQPFFSAPVSSDPMLGFSATNIAYWWHAEDATNSAGGYVTNWLDKISGKPLYGGFGGGTGGFRTNNYVSLQRDAGVRKNFWCTNVTEINGSWYTFAWVFMTPTWTLNAFICCNYAANAGVEYSYSGYPRIYQFSGAAWHSFDYSPLNSTNVHDFIFHGQNTFYWYATNGVENTSMNYGGSVNWGNSFWLTGNQNDNTIPMQLYDLFIFTNTAASTTGREYVNTNIHAWRTNYYKGI